MNDNDTSKPKKKRLRATLRRIDDHDDDHARARSAREHTQRIVHARWGDDARGERGGGGDDDAREEEGKSEHHAVQDEARDDDDE
jgi:hypothetical protein